MKSLVWFVLWWLGVCDWGQMRNSAPLQKSKTQTSQEVVQSIKKTPPPTSSQDFLEEFLQYQQDRTYLSFKSDVLQSLRDGLESDRYVLAQQRWVPIQYEQALRDLNGGYLPISSPIKKKMITSMISICSELKITDVDLMVALWDRFVNEQKIYQRSADDVQKRLRHEILRRQRFVR